MTRTFIVKPHGKKFVTNCRIDGYASVTFLSKTSRAARRKGDEFVSGKRTALRKFRTRHGENMDVLDAWDRRAAFLQTLTQ